MIPTDNRATAERLAREVYDSDTQKGDLLTRCVLAGMAERDRTAEREAAEKAFRFGWNECTVDRSLPHSRQAKREEKMHEYLAAEFDAGERVTLSDGSVVWRDNDGQWCRGPATDLWKVRSFDWTGVLGMMHTGADFDAVKRLAERGAER